MRQPNPIKPGPDPRELAPHERDSGEPDLDGPDTLEPGLHERDTSARDSHTHESAPYGPGSGPRESGRRGSDSHESGAPQPSSPAPDALDVLAVLDAPAKQPPASPVMDGDFIERNQIIERYLAGKLPVRGAAEFERYCKEHPELLDEIGLPDHVNAALKLLDASGKPQPWEPQPKRFWENPWLPIGLGVAVLILLATTLSFARSRAAEGRTLVALNAEIAAQPLYPATETRTIRVLPSQGGPSASSSPAVVIGGDGQTQLADLLLDLSRSPYHEYRVTIDRIGEGRVAIINHLAKDSNGHLDIAFNSSALGPGDYLFTIEGLTWRGSPVPDSWVTIGIEH